MNERPTISLMGIQSGDYYLTEKINEYSEYSNFLNRKITILEEALRNEGMDPESWYEANKKFLRDKFEV